MDPLNFQMAVLWRQVFGAGPIPRAMPRQPQPPKEPHPPHHGKSLYFALCGDAVKIGVSSDPTGRMETLQTGAPFPLELLAVIEEAGPRESECHRRLAHLNIHGEWFRYTSEVESLIAELRRS